MSCFFKVHAPEGLRQCDGPTQKHHAIKQQTIRRKLPKPRFGEPDSEFRAYRQRLGAAIGDSRNLLTVCKRHHDLWHNSRITVSRGDIPEALEAFAEEYGLGYELDRLFGVPEGQAI